MKTSETVVIYGDYDVDGIAAAILSGIGAKRVKFIHTFPTAITTATAKRRHP